MSDALATTPMFDEHLTYSSDTFTIDQESGYSLQAEYETSAFPVDYHCKNIMLSKNQGQICPANPEAFIESEEDYVNKGRVYPGPKMRYKPKDTPTTLIMRHYMFNYNTGEMSKFMLLSNCVISYSPYAGIVKAANNTQIGMSRKPRETMYLGNYIYLGIDRAIFDRITNDIVEIERNATGTAIKVQAKDQGPASRYSWPIVRIPTDDPKRPYHATMVSGGVTQIVNCVSLMVGQKTSLLGDAMIQFRANVRKDGIGAGQFQPQIDIQIHGFCIHGTSEEQISGQVTARIENAKEASAEMFQLFSQYAVTKTA